MAVRRYAGVGARLRIIRNALGFNSIESMAEEISKENPQYPIARMTYNEQELGRMLYPEVYLFLLRRGVNLFWLLTGDGYWFTWGVGVSSPQKEKISMEIRSLPPAERIVFLENHLEEVRSQNYK